jgi:hypothetical protein
VDHDVLNHILNGVVSVDSYFQQNYDCTRLRGLSTLQNVTPIPLDIKGGQGHPQTANTIITSIFMSNIRTYDIGLLSSGRPEPI